MIDPFEFPNEEVEEDREDIAASMIRKKGFDCSDLDEIIHEVASQKASDINNSGLEGQVEFLISNGWTEEGIIKYLEEE